MEKTVKEEKATIIKLFAEAIERNTTNAHQVWCIIHAMQDACDFMEDKRYKYRTELPSFIRDIRECLVKNLDHAENKENALVSYFDDISDELLEVILLAGANAEGLILINNKSLRDELHGISDEYNS